MERRFEYTLSRGLEIVSKGTYATDREEMISPYEVVKLAGISYENGDVLMWEDFAGKHESKLVDSESIGEEYMKVVINGRTKPRCFGQFLGQDDPLCQICLVQGECQESQPGENNGKDKEGVKMTKEELLKKKMKELRALAKEHGVNYEFGVTKRALVEAILEAVQAQEPEPEPEEPEEVHELEEELEEAVKKADEEEADRILLEELKASSLSDLRELAKAYEISTKGLKKNDLVEILWAKLKEEGSEEPEEEPELERDSGEIGELEPEPEPEEEQEESKEPESGEPNAPSLLDEGRVEEIVKRLEEVVKTAQELLDELRSLVPKSNSESEPSKPNSSKPTASTKKGSSPIKSEELARFLSGISADVQIKRSRAAIRWQGKFVAHASGYKLFVVEPGEALVKKLGFPTRVSGGRTEMVVDFRKDPDLDALAEEFEWI